MKRLKLVAVLEYDDDAMHGSDPDAIEWFRDAVLLGGMDESSSLLLHSNELGDTIGEVRVLSIEDL